MNYRKRHRLQHKVELSTLLKIVLAKKKNKYLKQHQSNDVNLTMQLATEAIELAEAGDAAFVVKNMKKRIVLESTKAVF